MSTDDPSGLKLKATFTLLTIELSFLEKYDSLFQLLWCPEAIADAKRDRQVKVIVTSIICTVTGMLLVGIIGWYTCRIRRARRLRRGKTAHKVP